MLKNVLLIFSLLYGFSLPAQEISPRIIKDIEQSGNSPLYVKSVLKKSFTIDTIAIAKTTYFDGYLDSIAYHGEIGKVYGPFEKGKILIQILATDSNRFNKIGQIFIDTSVFTFKVADSLSNHIIRQIMIGNRSFEDMAMTYSMGGEAAEGGNLGWIAAGYTIPQLDEALLARPKGDLFKMWTRRGVHIIQKLDDTKIDRGYALILKIIWKE